MSATSTWRLRDTLTAAALFLATAAFTLWQNTRVAVLWDISFLLDTAYRFTLHQLPYRDLPFPYAPLTFLLHSAIIKLFGRAYYPHILCAALEAGTATILTWRILTSLIPHTSYPTPVKQEPRVPHDRQAQQGAAIVGALTSGHPWALATLLAAPLTILGIHGIYPHPIYDSDCILAVLAVLYLLQRKATSSPASFLAGAICVLTLFIKQNIGGPFLLITLIAVAVIAISRCLQRTTITPQLWFFGGALTAFAAALLTLHATVGLHNYLYWTVTFATQRRLPGLNVVLTAYRQTALLWTLPTTVLALILLCHNSLGAPSMPQSHRGMGAMRYRQAALFLLAAPFLWTILSLFLATDPDDRADQLLSLWPHLLILATVLALWNLRPSNWKNGLTFTTLLPLILLATIHGAFLSQQLWGSTYATWPLLTLLIAALLAQVPAIARPLTAIIATTFLICGGLYAISHERLDYIHLEGARTSATLPELHGLTTPGPWIPAFEELIRVTNAEIPANDGILLVPEEDPFYFATGRTPQFPILLFDPATAPYTPQQTLEEARTHNIRWLIVPRNLQLAGPPHPDLPEITRTLLQDFTHYRTLTNYDIYRRRQASQ